MDEDDYGKNGSGKGLIKIKTNNENYEQKNPERHLFLQPDVQNQLKCISDSA